MKICLCFSLLLILSSCQPNRNLESPENNGLKNYDDSLKKDVYTFTDEIPEYPGGSKAFFKFISENFKYPNQDDFQTSFVYEFIVDVDGSIINPKVNPKNKTK